MELDDFLGIVLMILVTLIVLLSLSLVGFSIYLRIEMEDFCESRGGEYVGGGTCIIWEGGKYVKYDIVESKGGLKLVR